VELAVLDPARAKVEALEDEIAKLPQVDCPVRHYFAPGLYAREMTIPAGVTLTGAVHKTEHLEHRRARTHRRRFRRRRHG
jgi:hypothetical protein